METYLWILYAVIALGASVFYGFYAVRIFTLKEGETLESKTKELPFKLHQGWLNFAGSLSGWLVLAYLIAYRRAAATSGELGLVDVAMALFALLGITGLLPNALSRGNYPR